jgi:hypothetical protein
MALTKEEEQQLEEIRIIKKKTKEQHLEDIIKSIDDLRTDLEKASKLKDLLVVIEDLPLRLTSISMQLTLWKHFNIDE